MSFFDRLAAFKAECEACAPGACVGCRRGGEHCEDCTAHEPEAGLPSDVTVTRLFAPEEEADLRSDAYERGMEGSRSAARRWTAEEAELVEATITEVARNQATFTADDVWAALPEGFPVTKGLASKLNAALRRGEIESTGTVTVAQRGGDHDHRQRLAVWASRIVGAGGSERGSRPATATGAAPAPTLPSGATASPGAEAGASRLEPTLAGEDPPPRSWTPPKWRCTKCGKGTTKARVLGSGMCGACEKIWTRPSLDETLDSIPVEWEHDVELALREQPTYDRAAAVMKRKHPLKGGRDWDMVLVLMVDHRKRMREGKYW